MSMNTPARPFSPKIDRNYPKPKLKLPPGACDCHFHFIGPQQQFTLKPNHVFSHLEFEDTTFEDWEKMQAALGLSRGLHVLSMMYEHNYEIALHAQCRYGDRIKSVIVPWPGITDGELDILTKAGVVGYRITWRLTKDHRSEDGRRAPPSAAGRCTTCTAPTKRRWTTGSRSS